MTRHQSAKFRSTVRVTQAQIDMANPRLSVAMRLNVMVWADVVSKAGAHFQHKVFNAEFVKPGSRKASSAFGTCLERGTPRPEIRHPDCSPGAALRIEKLVPGSLKWLVHPIWDVLDQPEEYRLEDVHRLMASLEPLVVQRLFNGPLTSLWRKHPTTYPDIARIADLGSLDALAAMVYLGIEGRETCTKRTVRAVVRVLNRALETWPCLQALKKENRETFNGLIWRAIYRCEVFSIDRESALADTSRLILEKAREKSDYPTLFPADPKIRRYDDRSVQRFQMQIKDVVALDEILGESAAMNGKKVGV